MAGNRLLGGMRALMGVPETVGTMAGNLFFDVGATGAEILSNPNAYLRAVASGVMGDHSLAEQWNQGQEARRAQLPTFEATPQTQAVQQQAVAAVQPAVQAVAEQFPNATQTAGEYLQNPTVQAVMKGTEALGLPVMRGARGIQRTIGADLKRETVGDLIGGAMAARAAPGADVAMTAYHGSPHKFDKFQMDKIGTGEGAQAYGHGLYFAENKGTAKTYRSRFNQKAHLGNITDAEWQAHNVYDRLDADMDATLKELTEQTARHKQHAENVPMPAAQKKYQQSKDALEYIQSDRFSPGNLYEVDIPDEHIDKMLDWDKPLSEQPESVQRYMKDVITLTGEDSVRKSLGYATGAPIENMRGSQFYGLLEKMHGQETASKLLNSDGIPGIKYLDGTSRSAGEGTRNFVVFDENSVKVLKRNNETLGDLLGVDR